ncbi:MAG: hypothetical protein J5I98_25480 [Phaeodactylibacter sp.]|nr:hypothetical protein [Phaeodactylibacter sp.]
MTLKTMPLDFTSWKMIRDGLEKTFNQSRSRKQGNLTVNQTPGNYTNLSLDIMEKTSVNVSETWLRDFFCHSFRDKPDKKWHLNLLNACCSYLYGEEISTEDYLLFKPAPSDEVFANYRIFWTGSTFNSANAFYEHELDLSLSKDSAMLRHNDDLYKGKAPIKLGNKVYIEAVSHQKNEQVYFILHVGDADREDLHYIPGIFAAGDHGNVHPCAGPIMLVREDVRSPDHALLASYFHDFIGNNLIKSWTISEVLEAIHSLRNGRSGNSRNTEKLAQVKLKEKLELYFGRRFFLYFWSWNDNRQEAQLGRAMLKIGTTENDVILGSDLGVGYAGSVAMLTNDHLHFNLRTRVTQEKSLSIKLKVGPDRVFPYALGIYSIISSHGSIEAGTILMEQYLDDNDIRSFEATVFPLSKPCPDEVPEKVWRYFQDKGLNFIKTPSEGIFDDEDFAKFYREQGNKKNIYRQSNAGIFIATPMSASMEDFHELREGVITLKEYLMELFEVPAYYAGESYSVEVGFTHAYTAAEIDLKKLHEASRFLLIHPAKVASSTLIELGWALAEKKSCVIFFKNKDDLPFLVQGLNRSPNVRLIPYNSMENLFAIAKNLGDRLFP